MPPRRNGGNVDVRQLPAGTRAFFPVFVPGANFATGDGHAAQGDVEGAYRDLHSGEYGGAVANPIDALTRILASMRGADGKMLVDSFFDDVRDLTGDERAWARPTLEVNGIWGGFQGEGVKTVLPNAAHAKITCRLVANQTPAKVVDAIEAHVHRVAQSGVRVAVQKFETAAMPYELPFDHPGNVAAAAVHRRLHCKEPSFIRMGASIPVVGMFLEALGAYTVDFAFGL